MLGVAKHAVGYMWLALLITPALLYIYPYIPNANTKIIHMDTRVMDC